MSKSKLLNGTETSFRRALIFCVKERIVGRSKKKKRINREARKGGGKIVILSTSTSAQIPNHKTSKKKRDISKQQHAGYIRATHAS